MRQNNQMKVFSGNSNKQLALETVKYLGTSLGEIEVSRFPDNEIKVRILENVRGQDTYVIQSTHSPSENLLELLIIIDALKRASARSVTAVVPYFGYARQDRKTKSREPISAKLIANLITVAGATRFVGIDLHAGQIQGFFDIPADNLTAVYILASFIKEKKLKDIVVLSPDVGGVARGNTFAQFLDSPQALFVKKRLTPENIELTSLIGEVKDKTVTIVDDAIHTGNTVIQATEEVLKRGAKEVYVCATHAVFAGDSLKKFENSPIKEVIVTDTIPIQEREIPTKFTVLTIAELLAKAIYSIHNQSSVSALFEFKEKK